MSPRRPLLLALPLVALLGLAACETESVLPETDGFGAAPNLPAPRPQAVPTVKIARAVGWPQGQTPVAAAGLAVNAFATELDHPRWLYVLPNGDVLVAESQAPAKPKEKKGGLRGWIEGLVMARAGSGDRPSADRISLLRDADGDGTAETKTVFLSGLTSPFGMALVGERLYVANADAVIMVPYQTGRTRID
ncbi:MAG TPA: sorbosone dehydrogenase family protein, partial [Brevundimonas diminuta]|nr:sorbosone dehydrogenase family protein [Brevundimonas diminuta]HRL25428.1 sorbosone dehydrogenase family protein [Brevundimonas diminuta]